MIPSTQNTHMIRQTSRKTAVLGAREPECLLFQYGSMTLYCFRNYIKAVLPGAGKEVKTMKKEKSMLVLGGSYSTFRGCNPEGFYRCFAT